MGLSLVRCPFCDRRYNVTGIPPGTKVLCTSCRTVLTVPGNRFVAPPPIWHRLVPRSAFAQLSSAVIGGLLLATACFVALKEAQVPSLSSGPVLDQGPVARPGTGKSQEHPALTIGENKVLDEFRQNDKFEIYESPELKPFVLVGEKNPAANLSDIFTQFENLLPKLYRTFMQEFGETPQLNLDRIENSELPIVFYTRRATYDLWWRNVYKKPSIPQVTGVFSYPERRVSLYYDAALDSIDSGRTQEVLLHEAIHQLVDHYTRGRSSTLRHHGAWWFQEGLGNYFEGYYETGGQLTLTPGKMTSRLPLAKELLSRPDPEAGYVPLKQLMSWDVDDIWVTWLAVGNERERERQVRKLQCNYAQVWALVHFFCHEAEGKYRPFFLEYFKAELQGEGNLDTFERLLNAHHPGLEFDQLEEQFKAYLGKL